MLGIRSFFLSALAVLAFASCDKEKNPIQPMAEVETRRKVLVEDYTGHMCGNCPGAAETIEKLSQQYGAKVVPVAVHAGFFARTNSKYPTSYTTTASVEWDKFFIGNSGYPNGLVNRTKTGSSYVKSPSSWASEIAVLLKKTHYIDLQISAAYSRETRNLNTSVKARFAKSYGFPTRISVLLLEDSIVGPQTDYRLENDYVTSYVFNHMLRDEINGTWGTTLTADKAAYNDSLTVSFPDFAVNPKFNDRHLSIVAFAYDANTREVIQAEKIKIK